MSDIHPSTLALARFFDYEHLPAPLAAVSEMFYRLAWDLIASAKMGELDPGAELTTALRKLLEAKDCAVRAALVAQDRSAS